MDTAAPSQCLSFVKYLNNKCYVCCYICLIVCATSSLPSVISSEVTNVSTLLSTSKAVVESVADSTTMTTAQPLSSPLSAPPPAAQLLDAKEQKLFVDKMTKASLPSPTLQPPLQKLDFVTSQVIDAEPIQGWRCYCWNSTNGSEVSVDVMNIAF